MYCLYKRYFFCFFFVCFCFNFHTVCFSSFFYFALFVLFSFVCIVFYPSIFIFFPVFLLSFFSINVIYYCTFFTCILSPSFLQLKIFPNLFTLFKFPAFPNFHHPIIIFPHFPSLPFLHPHYGTHTHTYTHTHTRKLYYITLLVSVSHFRTFTSVHRYSLFTLPHLSLSLRWVAFHG